MGTDQLIGLRVCILTYRGGVQYRGGYLEYHGGYLEYHGGYLEYCGGCSVP